MHRCSESIASLAAALAKAQCELTNPEKSLVATIGPGRPGEGARSFRYAPLASGLEIVRKALGAQQIATVQATAIDASIGTVNLTTVLAHASGEWIAADWPVCRIADGESPHLRHTIVDGAAPGRLRVREEIRGVAAEIIPLGPEMIVDDVEKHHQAAQMCLVDQQM